MQDQLFQHIPDKISHARSDGSVDEFAEVLLKTIDEAVRTVELSFIVQHILIHHLLPFPRSLLQTARPDMP